MGLKADHDWMCFCQASGGGCTQLNSSCCDDAPKFKESEGPSESCKASVIPESHPISNVGTDSKIMFRPYPCSYLKTVPHLPTKALSLKKFGSTK